MIQVNNGTATVLWTQKQLELIEEIQRRERVAYLFGGGMGSGKTQLMARLFLSLLESHPKTRAFVFRKNRSVLKRTTYQTFKEVAEEFNHEIKMNDNEMVWKYPNGSQLWFQELDKSKDQDWNKIKGIEPTWIGIDEANEVEEGAFNILLGRLWRCNPNDEPSFIFLTCNPSQGWVKDKFYTPSIEGILDPKFYFKQALAKDNPFLPGEYMETLELLPEAEYQRYVLGNWDFSDDPNQLIKYEWIKKNIWDIPQGDIDTLGIDVAREGDDKTVFAFGNKEGLHKLKSFQNQDTMATAQLAIENMKENKIGASKTAVDVVGVGGGVVDGMRSAGFNVIDYNSGKAPTKKAGHLLFRNLRAETFWDLRLALQEGEYKLINDKQLTKELLGIHYEVTDKVIQIESKAKMKKRIGHSPDFADALVINRYANRGKITLPIGMF